MEVPVTDLRLYDEIAISGGGSRLVLRVRREEDGACTIIFMEDPSETPGPKTLTFGGPHDPPEEWKADLISRKTN